MDETLRKSAAASRAFARLARLEEGDRQQRLADRLAINTGFDADIGRHQIKLLSGSLLEAGSDTNGALGAGMGVLLNQGSNRIDQMRVRRKEVVQSDVGLDEEFACPVLFTRTYSDRYELWLGGHIEEPLLLDTVEATTASGLSFLSVTTSEAESANTTYITSYTADGSGTGSVAGENAVASSSGDVSLFLSGFDWFPLASSSSFVYSVDYQISITVKIQLTSSYKIVASSVNPISNITAHPIPTSFRQVKAISSCSTQILVVGGWPSVRFLANATHSRNLVLQGSPPYGGGDAESARDIVSFNYPDTASQTHDLILDPGIYDVITSTTISITGQPKNYPTSDWTTGFNFAGNGSTTSSVTFESIGPSVTEQPELIRITLVSYVEDGAIKCAVSHLRWTKEDGSDATDERLLKYFEIEGNAIISIQEDQANQSSLATIPDITQIEGDWRAEAGLLSFRDDADIPPAVDPQQQEFRLVAGANIQDGEVYQVNLSDLTALETVDESRSVEIEGADIEAEVESLGAAPGYTTDILAAAPLKLE